MLGMLKIFYLGKVPTSPRQTAFYLFTYLFFSENSPNDITKFILLSIVVIYYLSP